MRIGHSFNASNRDTICETHEPGELTFAKAPYEAKSVDRSTRHCSIHHMGGSPTQVKNRM